MKLEEPFLKKMKKMRSNYFAICLLLISTSCNTNSKSLVRSYYHLGSNDSILQVECEISNDKLNGYYKKFYKNSQLKFKAYYVEDKLFALDNVFDTSGKKLEFGKIKEGNGCVYVYDDEGQKKEKGWYINGYKNGTWYDINYRNEIIGNHYYRKGKLKELEGFNLNVYE